MSAPPSKPDRARRGAHIILVGAAAGLLLALFELIAVRVLAPLAFDTLAEKVRFTFASLLLLSSGGALAGALQALMVWTARALAPRVWPNRSLATGQARVYTLLAAPPVLWALQLLFSGRRARTIPGARALAVLIALVLLVLLLVALRGVLAGAARLAHDAPRPRRAVAWATAFAACAGALLALDRAVLPRLYLPFHLGLEALGFAMAELAVGVLYLGALRPRPSVERQLRSWLGGRRPAVLLLALALGTAWALRNFNHLVTLRAAVFTHTSVAQRLLAGTNALGLTRARPTGWQTPVAIGGESDEEEAASAALPLAGPRVPDADVFLISVDAMRADRLTAETAPRLHVLAQQSVLFTSAYTQVPHTSFALATLLTGKYVYSLAALGEDPASHETLPEVLRTHRYKTAAFYPPSIFFIDRDKFTTVEKQAYRFEYVRYEYMKAGGRTDQVIRFLETEKPQRVLAWVHYFEPHEPYDLHPGITIAGRAPVTAAERYDGEIRFVDAEIGRLIDYIRRTRPRALIVFTADHGEEFGEHGGRYHGTTLYEEQVHVPLFFSAPGLPPRRIATPVGLIDVAPTVLGLLDILPSAQMRGTDLGPLMALSPAVAGTTETAPRGLVFAEIGSKKLVASDRDRLICDVSLDFCELYDVATDPGEQHNLVATAPERAARARARLDAWLASQSAREQPKSRVRAAAEQEALERGRQGDRSAALKVAQLLAASDPVVRSEAALVLLRLPPDPATAPWVQAARPPQGSSHGQDIKTSARLNVIAFRLGETSLADAVAAAARVDPDDTELAAHAALALAAAREERAIPLLARALETVRDEDLEKRLIAALGDTREPRALVPLLAHLGPVRTRGDVVRALGMLGDHRAVAPLAHAVVHEPYVPVRREMVRVLGMLGGGDALPVLRRLWQRETEAPVVSALAVSLTRLGALAMAGGIDLRQRLRATSGWACDATGCLPDQAERRVPIDRRMARAREQWLVTAGSGGALEVDAAVLPVVAGMQAQALVVSRVARRVRLREGEVRLVALLMR